ncbi:L-aspartate oxidase [Elizabethkingia meningoseptica]|uniref:L-aspartate oxidase n=1 Tax=Elizabethkingia meningoseptica TaxID=238 RepID=UPI000332C965|nr:L-aspartate oxidase [Elizabethkingia meningoseptica]AQX04594.1 L-aspartate oxidase [Elizabethkingia meningoseptica]AQX46638.1 L-aspartate oxidase [Elizabethkingia meningoseptica]EOR31397.1 L-aspartate oxidase [Elizabethkingia meningoseptica ATCC 13253 = NBRC 12535]KUY19152.1 L-aspartate oxidase [Elizabethkingia meningoseptica]MDE5490095.1 L-aspartate oxidase [Elizabethkingia meningoseptica]
MIKADVLVIGSGISGLSYAIKIAETLPDAQITIVTKSDEDESNTKYAQGGLAVVTDFSKDNFEKHIEDTMRAGDGENKRDVVEMVVKEGPHRFRELVEWGTRFDKEKDGDFKLGREGGHTENRIVHHKDITGFEIERALLATINKLPNIEVLDHHYVIDLITQHHVPGKELNQDNIHCYGAYILDQKNKKIKKITAKITLVATGGAGHVYKNTTNPIIATGDGIAFVHRARGKVSNMQYYQFHPTAMFSKRSGMLFLISEAVRGDGAKLRTKDGQPFMHKYDEREELASRDIVARAIDNEMKISGDDYVGLDCRHMDQENFKEHFPNIYKKCLEEGIDPFQQLIPVVPACHYLMGGIDVDIDGQSSIKNLFAVGECTNSGLHGANRLASNSLLEGLVFGHQAAVKTVELLEKNEFNFNDLKSVPEWNQEGMKILDEMVMVSYFRKQLQEMMSDLVGIVRSNARLQIAKKKQREIYEAVTALYNNSILSPQLSELRNLVNVSYLIIKHSIEMKENKGAFFNKDLV